MLWLITMLWSLLERYQKYLMKSTLKCLQRCNIFAKNEIEIAVFISPILISTFQI